jgi:N-acetylmuramoyl-L-alanine amidase
MTWNLLYFLRNLFVLLVMLFALFLFGCDAHAQDAPGSISINEDSVTVSKWLIILDPAHGIETPGKRSPDGRFREYKFSRDVIEMLSGIFDSVGIHYKVDNETVNEIGLRQRVAYTNKFVKKFKNKSLFLSFHTNAAGNGTDWMQGRGFSVWTTRGKTKADILAKIIVDEFAETFPYIKMIGMREANFRVLLCAPPAVLCEALFQDNEEDVDILLSDWYRRMYCGVIVRSIKKYILEQ